MSKALLVLGHGRTSGLGHHLLGVARETLTGLGVPHRVHDLLADEFDPRLRLAAGATHATACSAQEDPLVHRYQEDVRWADAYVVVHPVWWFAPPAILKGWVDRVLVDGVAIRQEATGPPAPLLGGRRALVVQTFNAARVIDRIHFRGIAGRFWQKVVFPSIGVEDVDLLALHDVEGLDGAVLRRFEAKLRRDVARLVGRR